MKKKSASKSAFFNLRVLIAFVFWLAGVFIAVGGPYLGASKAEAQFGPGSAAPRANSPGTPDVVHLAGPVCVNTDLRDLPYIPPTPGIRRPPLIPHRWPKTGAPPTKTYRFTQFQSLLKKVSRPVPTMPSPLLTFDGITFVESGIEQGPPDTNGDVGPNHYVQSVNDSFKVFDKNGNILSGPTTFNSFFAPLGNGTPCGA